MCYCYSFSPDARELCFCYALSGRVFFSCFCSYNKYYSFCCAHTFNLYSSKTEHPNIYKIYKAHNWHAFSTFYHCKRDRAEIYHYSSWFIPSMSHFLWFSMVLLGLMSNALLQPNYESHKSYQKNPWDLLDWSPRPKLYKYDRTEKAKTA